MKKCVDMELKLNAYLEGLLSGKEKDLVEEHLRDCPDCARALEGLKRTRQIIGSLDEIEPPPWLAAKVMSRIHEESEVKKSFFRKLFFPLHIKIPVEALAAACVVVLSVLIYQSTAPDIKSVQRPLPEAQLSGQVPVDAGSAAQQHSVSKAPPEKTLDRQIGKKDAQERKVSAVESREKSEQTQSSPQKSLAAQQDTPPVLSGKDSSPGLAGRMETYGTKTGAADDHMKEAPPVLKAGPHPAAKMRPERNAADTMMKKEKTMAPAARPAQPAESKEPRNRIFVLTDRPSETAGEVQTILLSVGGKGIEKKWYSGETVISGMVDTKNIDELLNRLKKTGTVDKNGIPAKNDTKSILIEITIRNTGVGLVD